MAATGQRKKRPALWVEIPGAGGRRKVRVGWSAREAGVLADDPPIPSRTVEHWAATGLVTPTVRPADVYPALYSRRADRDADDVCYGLGDVVALRMVRDLLARGWDRDLVESIAEDIAGWGPERGRDWRSLIPDDALYLLPVRVAGVAECRRRGMPAGWPVREDEVAELADGGELVHIGGGWREIRWDYREPMALYPVSDVVEGIVGRVEEWRQAEGIGASQLAAWL